MKCSSIEKSGITQWINGLNEQCILLQNHMYDPLKMQDGLINFNVILMKSLF